MLSLQESKETSTETRQRMADFNALLLAVKAEAERAGEV